MLHLLLHLLFWLFFHSIWLDRVSFNYSALRGRPVDKFLHLLLKDGLTAHRDHAVNLFADVEVRSQVWLGALRQSVLLKVDQSSARLLLFYWHLVRR